MNQKSEQKPEAAGGQQGNNEQNENPQVSPPNDFTRIRDRKKEVITGIQKICSDPVWQERLLKIAKGDESKILKAINSYVTFLANDQGSGKNPKTYICECSMSSLFSVFLEAFGLGLDIGSRDLVSVQAYGITAELEISYKGFVFALSRHFDNSFVQVGNYFDGDVFTAKITDSTASFTHEPKNLFDQSWQKLKGVYCHFAYTLKENGKEVSKLVVIDKPQLEMIKSKAKITKVWDQFWTEMALKACLKRAAKIPFASIDFTEGEINPADIDNRQYQLEDKRESSGDRLKKLMEKQREVFSDEPKKQEIKENSGGDGSPEGIGGKAEISESLGEANKSGSEADPEPQDTGSVDGQSREAGKVDCPPAGEGLQVAKGADGMQIASEAAPEASAGSSPIDQAKPQITDADFEEMEGEYNGA